MYRASRILGVLLTLVIILGLYWFTSESSEAPKVNDYSKSISLGVARDLPVDSYDSNKPGSQMGREDYHFPTDKVQTKTTSSHAKDFTEQDQSTIPIYDSPKNQLVAEKIGERWVVQGDILVGENQLVQGVGDAHHRVASLESIQYWPDKIPVSISEEFMNEPYIDLLVDIQRALLFFNSKTNICFIDHYGETDFIHFSFSEGPDICLSYFGMKGGPQDIVLGRNCTQGQIIHELMHALGFPHEHSREDRDQFLQVNWANIDRRYYNQFQKLPDAISNPGRGPFDFESVLLYPQNAFARSGLVSLAKLDGTEYKANRRKLSETDIQKINNLYPTIDCDRSARVGVIEDNF